LGGELYTIVYSIKLLEDSYAIHFPKHTVDA